MNTMKIFEDYIEIDKDDVISYIIKGVNVRVAIVGYNAGYKNQLYDMNEWPMDTILNVLKFNNVMYIIKKSDEITLGA